MSIRDKALLDAAEAQSLVTEHQRDEARREARRVQRDEMTTLCYSLRIPPSSFIHAYAVMNELPFLRPSQLQVDEKRIHRMSPSFIRQFRALPVLVDNAYMSLPHIVTDTPDNPALRNQLSRLFKGDVQICVTEPAAMDYGMQVETGHTPSAAAFDAVAELNEVFNQAYLHRASDIHIEPMADVYIIRLRVDGRLHQYGRRFQPAEGASLISRIKVMANIDIAETRMPQDGGASYQPPLGDEFDLRIATAPTKFGERVTIRLLGTDNQLLTLKQLGMSEDALTQFSEIIEQPHGIILITGPTGSGKSTTLYAALAQLQCEETNILTAEDPVEMVVEGISQVQMNAKVNFASALRSFLRHDPDVIMVGEIRDTETGEIALKAATTGHLVLSTLHTNSAISSITRLKDIGLEPFLIASSLLGVIAQRLARRLCQNCKEETTPNEQDRKALALTEQDVLTLWQPKGCPLCGGTGFKGRIALFETFWLDEEMESLITQGVDELVLRKQAKHFTSLAHDGRDKVLQGLTTMSELQRLGLLGRIDEEEAL
ncbi:MAG: GspE/PulE family protein [Gammaproteobacteria bacterium]|nr:GspE/PulE family protein [Gammaproteobacteria bacterium]